jgi:hypothetical protein
MMSKSLTYAYQSGGPVGMALPPRVDTTPTYTPEQLAQMEENQRIREAAEASIAASKARQAQIHAENPHIDFSQAGHDLATQQALAALAEGQAQDAGLTFGGGGGGSGDGRPDSTVYNPDQITGVTQGGLGFSGNPEHFSTTPSYQAAPTYDEFYQLPDRQPTAPAPDYNLGMGDVASAFAQEMGYVPPEANTYDLTVRAPEGGAYVPPVQQGLGSMQDRVFDGYLMYSNPTQDVFIRPGG